MSTNDNAALAERLLARTWNLSIGGEARQAASGRRYDVENPSTTAVVASVPDGDSEDADAAVRAAADAFGRWSALTVFERADYLMRLAEAVRNRSEEFAVLDAVCGGAPIGEMRNDVATSVKALRYFAGVAPQLTGETIPASSNLHFTERVPFGVVVRIVAFNHPFMFSVAKIAAPLMAGNTVVVKPPEVAPLSALLFGEVAATILPKGVLSVVVGDGPGLPRALVRHPDVRRIGFVGSENTGRAIQRDAAEAGVKTVSLELGGKNALIACEDADVETVAVAAVRGMNFTWAGQSCGSTSRLLVHESIADAVVRRIIELVGPIRMGPAIDEATQMGPVVSLRQLDRITRDVERALAEGAVLVVGGGRGVRRLAGHFLEPTVLEVTRDMQIAGKEVFGPVLSVLRFSGTEEMVEAANAVGYGLTAAIYTSDITRALRLARRLEVGFVWINGVSQHFTGVPYGGVKASGIGRDEAFEELVSYTQTKAVTVFL